MSRNLAREKHRQYNLIGRDMFAHIDETYKTLGVVILGISAIAIVLGQDFVLFTYWPTLTAGLFSV